MVRFGSFSTRQGRHGKDMTAFVECQGVPPVLLMLMQTASDTALFVVLAYVRPGYIFCIRRSSMGIQNTKTLIVMLCVFRDAKYLKIESNIGDHHLSGGGGGVFPPENQPPRSEIQNRGGVSFSYTAQGENPEIMLTGRRGTR